MLLHLIFLLILRVMRSPLQLASAVFNRGCVVSVITALPPPNDKEYPLCESVKWLTNKRYVWPFIKLGILQKEFLRSFGSEAHWIKLTPEEEAPVLPYVPAQLPVTTSDASVNTSSGLRPVISNNCQTKSSHWSLGDIKNPRMPDWKQGGAVVAAARYF